MPLGGPATGRLAPTPSGRLHLGNTLSFGLAWLSARSAGGRLLLRIEDVDIGRARPEIEVSIREDLLWLGLVWDEETAPQRDRDYAPWLEVLRDETYRCACSRKQRDPSGRYPGTCREAGHAEGAVRWRLPQSGPVAFRDRRYGPHTADPALFGDPILQRRDGAFTYPLAVVVDDLRDGVTEVVRGADLLDHTGLQMQLWRAFSATPPSYLHGPLLLGADGKKLSKSHGSTEIAALRASGATPRDIWRRLLPILGLQGDHIEDALPSFRPDLGALGPVVVS